MTKILIPNLFMGMGAGAPRMEAKTADYTCTLADSGTVFHTTGATAAVNFTLPAINGNPFRFLFINGADQNMTVTANAADTIVTYNDLAADSVAFSTASEKIGGVVEVWCDGTTLFVLPRAADGRYQTATIAT
jgi:hypothetical protein